MIHIFLRNKCCWDPDLRPDFIFFTHQKRKICMKMIRSSQRFQKMIESYSTPVLVLSWNNLISVQLPHWRTVFVKNISYKIDFVGHFTVQYWLQLGPLFCYRYFIRERAIVEIDKWLRSKYMFFFHFIWTKKTVSELFFVTQISICEKTTKWTDDYENFTYDCILIIWNEILISSLWNSLHFSPVRLDH